MSQKKTKTKKKTYTGLHGWDEIKEVFIYKEKKTFCQHILYPTVRSNSWLPHYPQWQHNWGWGNFNIIWIKRNSMNEGTKMRRYSGCSSVHVFFIGSTTVHCLKQNLYSNNT